MPAIESFALAPNGGLILPGNAFTALHFSLIADLAARNHLPSIGLENWAKNGGLISYSVNPIDDFRRAAGYVDRILKGESPGDLPVQLANRFRLTINLKTAKALGLAISERILQTADEVIE